MLQRVFHRPGLFAMGALAIALGGIASVDQLPVDLFPDLNYPLINVITHYPAGTAEDVELLITRPIENAMLGLTNLQRVRSVSAAGFSQVTVEFNWGVDVTEARQIVASRLTQAQSSLPAGAGPEIENIGTSLAMVSTYGLLGADTVALRAWAQYELAPKLTSLPGVARVAVMGGGRQAFRVDLDQQKLTAHHITLDAVVEAIADQHVLDTGGYIEQHGRDLLIRTDARIRDLTTLAELVISRSEQGHAVRVADVAHVYEGTVPERYRVSVDRLPAVVFTVQKQIGASTLDVSQQVSEALKHTSLPEGVRVRKFYDQAEIIGLAYRNMRNNLLMGALLAVGALVWVLGRGRSTWIVAVTIPLAVLGTFLLLHVFGLGLNLITLAALTVAIGLIDDDSIIVLENIERHRALGKSPIRAALDGLKEIVAADLAGTLTVLSAFVPLLLVTGLAGRLFRPFGLTFSFMIGLSFVFSVTLIPVAVMRVGKGATPQTSQGKLTLGGRAIAWLGGINDRMLAVLLRHRTWTIATAGAMFVGAVSLLALNPVRFLPLLDEDSLLASYELAPGTSLRESNRVADQLEREILALPTTASVFRRTGSPEESFYPEGPNQGELMVRLRHDRPVSADQVRQQLVQMLADQPGVLGRVNEPTSEKLDESFSGLPALFGITVYGRDLDVLYDAASKIEQAARAVPGVGNVVNNTKVSIDQLVVRVNRSKCAELNVDATQVARAVRIAFQGDEVGVTLLNQRPVAFFVRYQPRDRKHPESLSSLLVPTRDGRHIPLAIVADIRRAAARPTIEHQRGLRSLTMPVEVDGNPLAVMRRLKTTIDQLQLAPSIQVRFAGEYQQLLVTGQQSLWSLVLAVLLVYGVIALQLGSRLDPLVVLAKVPIDFFGAAIALSVMRQPLDLTLPLGLITLVGVSVNNGIVLLTFTRSFREQGLAAETAVRQAVRIRFRPMVLTHLTTLLALIPAGLGIGRGPQLLQPLAILLFGGLTAGTLLTLNLLPVLYLSSERWRRHADRGV